MNPYFVFSKTEKKGVFILITIIIALILLLAIPKNPNADKEIAVNKTYKPKVEKKEKNITPVPSTVPKIKKTVTNKPKVLSAAPKKRKKEVELNSATKEQLIELRGIGDVLSSRIIKFRNALGGFLKKEQFKEVYGISEELYRSLENQLKVNPEKVKKININSATFKEINRHPYISYELTKLIVNKRRFSAYNNFNELLTIPLINDSLYNKITPYLTH